MINNLKIFFLLVVGVAALHAAVYEYDIHIADPVFIQKDAHMAIDIPGCMPIGMEGEPLRPHISIAYALPPGETLENVDLILNDVRSFPLMLPLLPKQADRPLSWGNSEKGLIKHDDVYAQNEYQVEQIKANVQWYRGVAIVMGTLDPGRYYPASGRIDIAQTATLRITTRNENRTVRLDRTDIDLLSEFVQNPEILSRYQSETDRNEKLLIITTNDLKPAFGVLQEHYKKFGIESQVIRVSDILLADVPGNDIQEKIRNKITELYLNDGLDYVLLGGNSNHVPHRGLSCQVLSGGDWVTSDDIPGDLYYAALDGDWDRNANGKFGEYLIDTGFDEADLLPELAIGRMPAETLQELQNMIDKSIRYQMEPVINELDKQVFFGEFLYADPESWAADYLELLIGRHTDNGYDTQGLPSVIQITKWYDQDSLDQWNKETIKSELANGTSFLHHDGHCNYTTMMKFSTSDINDSDFVSVNGIDHTMPIFYSHGCNCGGFDKYNCIASRFVTSPFITVGGVFNSRYGWFNEGQTEGPSIHLHREFENAIYGLNFDHFGWALSISKIKTAPWITAPNQHEQNALRWNYYCQNILGDPVMRIYSDVPVNPEVYCDAIQDDTESTKAAVYVMTPDQAPIENAGVAVLDTNGILIGFNTTDATGYAEIGLSTLLNVGESVHCYITGHNMVPVDTLLTIRTVHNFPVTHTMPNIYPNPFNPNTNIEYCIPNQTTVDIQLYDISGKFVKTIYNGSQTAGTYKIAFEGGNLPSGIYICRIQLDDFVSNKKMTLLK